MCKSSASSGIEGGSGEKALWISSFQVRYHRTGNNVKNKQTQNQDYYFHYAWVLTKSSEKRKSNLFSKTPTIKLS